MGLIHTANVINICSLFGELSCWKTRRLTESSQTQHPLLSSQHVHKGPSPSACFPPWSRCPWRDMLMYRRLHHLFLVPSLGDDFQVVPSLNLSKWQHFPPAPCFFWLLFRLFTLQSFLNDPKTGDMLIENNQSVVVWSSSLLDISILLYRVCWLSGWSIIVALRCTCLLNCLSCHGSYRWGLDYLGTDL